MVERPDQTDRPVSVGQRCNESLSHKVTPTLQSLEVRRSCQQSYFNLL